MSLEEDTRTEGPSLLSNYSCQLNIADGEWQSHNHLINTPKGPRNHSGQHDVNIVFMARRAVMQLLNEIKTTNSIHVEFSVSSRAFLQRQGVGTRDILLCCRKGALYSGRHPASQNRFRLYFSFWRKRDFEVILRTITWNNLADKIRSLIPDSWFCGVNTLLN